jgi:PE family/PPE-SVP subfamily C-terminal region
MSFLTTQPEELAAAAGKLGVIGSASTAQNAAAGAPTTGLIPAAADEVSALQAALFTAFGTLYQQVSAEATAMYDAFVNTLGASAGTYQATEALNSSAAGSTLPSALAAVAAPAAVDTPAGDLANLLDIGVGNWGSAASNFLGLANGGLLLPETDAAEWAGTAEIGASVESAAMAGAAGAPVAGMAVASSVGALSAPPTWAGSVTLASQAVRAGAPPGLGWVAATPQAAPTTLLPGMPGMVATGRNSAGFGAPRYGVKPIVMPRPGAV